MNMQTHILTALQEQLARWEAQLARLGSVQITTPLAPSPWTVKDELAHLMAWQARSIARLEAARDGRIPQFPRWLPDLDPDAKGNTQPINAWIYQTYRDQPWLQVHSSWREGYQRFITLGQAISERDLLDSSLYPWMDSRPLILVMLASYDHHQEHLEKIQAWLGARGM